MNFSIRCITAALVSALFCVTACAAKRTHGVWNYYHFGGSGFVAGKPDDGSPFVAVGENLRPVVSAKPSTIAAVELPPDKGAIVGICYIQSSGGKLAGRQGGYIPCPRIPVQIFFSGTVTAKVTTDDQGYFVTELDAGTYRVGNAPFSVGGTSGEGENNSCPFTDR